MLLLYDAIGFSLCAALRDVNRSDLDVRNTGGVDGTRHDGTSRSRTTGRKELLEDGLS